MGILDDTALTIFCLSVLIASNAWHLFWRLPITTPANILLSWIGLFFGLAPFFELYKYYKADSYYYSIFAGVTGLIIGAICLPKIAFKTVLAPRDDAQLPIPTQRVRQIMMVLIGYYVAYAVGNIWRAGSFNISQLYIFDPYTGLDMQDNWLRLVKLTRPIAEAALFIVIGITIWTKTKGRYVWIFVTCGVFVVSNLTAYGGRQGVILLPAVAALLACWRWKRMELRIILVTTSIAFVGMVLLQLVRHQRLDTLIFDPVDAMISSTGSGGEWNSVGTLADLVHYSDSRDIPFSRRVELTFIEIGNWGINWIPRAIWPEKPADTSFSPRLTYELYSDRMATETWVRTFTFIGQGYYLFGVPGAFFTGFLYGTSLLLLFGLLRSHVEYYGICAALLYKALIATRNDFGSWFFQAMSLVVVAFVIHKVMRWGLIKRNPWLDADKKEKESRREKDGKAPVKI